MSKKGKILHHLEVLKYKAISDIEQKFRVLYLEGKKEHDLESLNKFWNMTGLNPIARADSMFTKEIDRTVEDLFKHLSDELGVQWKGDISEFEEKK